MSMEILWRQKKFHKFLSTVFLWCLPICAVIQKLCYVILFIIGYVVGGGREGGGGQFTHFRHISLYN